MSDATAAQTQLSDLLAGLRRRKRVVNCIRWTMYGLLAGAAVACIAASVVWAAMQAPAARLVWVGAGCAAAVTVLAALAGVLLPVDDLRLARAMDRAASSDDRLASAIQLIERASPARRQRAGLILRDALSHMGGANAAAALPVRVPRMARYIPVPILALIALVLVLPQAGLHAVATPAAEISGDEWSALHDQFSKELAQIPKARTSEEQEIQEQLEQLAAMLKQNPDKKDVLREIARLSDRIEHQKRAAGAARAQSMKSAAKAITDSQALKPFADKLQQGAYDQAAGELSKLSEQLKSGEASPDAKEFESMAADLQRLSDQMQGEKDLQSECQKCSGACSSMNRQALSEALKRFAEEMKKNAEKMRQCDSMCRRSSALDELKRLMNQCEGCKSCKDGDGFCQKPGAKKGGSKAGWGSVAKWEGGTVAKANEDRRPDLVDPLERSGANTTFQVVSPDEKAVSARRYEEQFAEFIAKNEADLDLESVPVAYREYLRKYFSSIRPKETAPAAPGSDSPE